MSKNTSRNRRIESIAVKYLLALVWLMNTSSCGGGGGATITNPNYGEVEGYVYAPVGSGARVAEAAPAGYMAVSGASVSISCGGSTKNTTTSSTGYYKMTSLPTGNCSLTVSRNGYGSYQTNVSLTVNSTTTVGGSGGILLSPSTSGAIKVTANVSGGEVIIDGKETNIVIPATLTYSFANISPGNHTVSISQIGYDSVSEQSVSVVQGATVEVSFVIIPSGNSAPIADAGSDQKEFAITRYIKEGWNGTEVVYTPFLNAITLDGTGSNDPESDSLEYQWSQDSGSVVSISNPNSATASFIPQLEGTYTFSLKVSDGYQKSASDTVTFYVSRPSGKLTYQTVPTNVSWDLFVFNADGTNRYKLTNSSSDDTNPAWSPDGGKVAYACMPTANTGDICVINEDGTGYAKITNHSNESISAPDWSSTSNKIVISKRLLNTYNIYSMNPDGTNAVELLISGNFIFGIEYSPDGSKLLFIADYGSDNNEIMVVNSDGSNMARLTNNATTELGATWTPDGRILYTSQNFLGDDTRHLYVINADGTGLQEIPMPAGVNKIRNPVVSSDGRFIFFSDDAGYLWVMYADGSAAMSYGLGGSSPDYHPGP